MNYKKVYDQLIEKRRQQPLSKDDCYCETHHIVPRGMNGTNDKSNLVNLTAREHYVAHLLLAKIYDTFGLYAAVTYMQTGNNSNRVFKFNSRLYQKVREELGKKMSVRTKGKFVGKPLSEEHRKKISESNKGKVISKENRLKLSNAMKGNKIWLGRHHSDKTKQQISNAGKGKVISERHKQRNREAMLGCVYWNNGKINVRSKTQPDGFVRGRLKRTT